MAASPETRNLVGSALAALLAGAAFLAMFQALHRTEGAVRARSQINQALQALDQGLSSLKDAETSQRGFLLTGRENYLGPYDSGRREARASLEAFQALEGARTLSADDPVEDVDQLKALTESKLDELARTVQLAQSGKRQDALALVEQGEGMATMDRIRVLHQRMTASLLLQRTHQDEVVRVSEGRARVALVGFGGLALLMLAFSAWRLHRDVKLRTIGENALAASEARLHLIVDGIQDYAILLLDPEGHVVSWNTGAERIKGYTEAEILGRHVSCFYTPEDAAEGRPQRLLAKAREQGRAEDEAWRVRKDGSRFWSNVIISALRDPEGRHIGFVKVTRDLTSHRRVVEELKASERRFRTLAEAAPVGIFEMDPEGNRPYINGTLCALAELTYEEATRLGFRHRIHPEDLDRVLEHWKRVRAGGTSSNLEYRFALPSGRIRWVESQAAPVQGEDGRPGNHIGIVIDRTDQRRITEELRASERRFRMLAEAAPMGIYELDLETGVVYANESHCRLTGIPQREGTRENFRASVHPEDAPQVLAQVEADIREGRTFDQEYRLHRKDGTDIWVHSRGTPLEGPSGTAGRYLIVTQDITEIRAKTAALEAANKELEAFAYSVSHDLRAPLRHIDGFVGLLRRSLGEGMGERPAHHLDVISASARQMGALIDDLLTFSRMGRAEVHAATFDLEALTRQVIGELEPDAAGRPIEWRVENLPSIQGDQALLRLVLLNLLGNALKFTRGRVPAKIGISAERSKSGIAISITDNGAGFDMRYADKLFGVFQRLHRQDEFEGTGIGLANVARIIHKHGGTVSAQGAVDQGATFSFTLPLPEVP